MEEESTDSWFTFKEVFIKRFRRQVSFTRVIQKAETCRWNSSKEDFLDYAARKIKLFQPLHLKQKSIINLLIGRIQDYAIKSAAAMIYIETVNEFLERMHQATNICAAATKKSSPSSVRKEKTKEPDLPSTKATHWKTKSNVSYCKAKGHVRIDCWKLRRKENASQNTSTSNTVAAAKETTETENTSTKDDSTEKTTNVACVEDNINSNEKVNS